MPRIFLLTSTASPSAIADWTGTMTTAKTTVLRSAAQKVSSENSRMKLSTPTNVAGRGEISRAFVKARMKVRMIGMIKKVISNTPAGTSISHATVAGLFPMGLLPWGGATAVAAAGVGSMSYFGSAHGMLLWFRCGCAGMPPAAVSKKLTARGSMRRGSAGGLASAARPRAGSSLEVVVGLLVGVDVLDRLIESLLRIGAVENVLGGLGELRRDEGVARRHRA